MEKIATEQEPPVPSAEEQARLRKKPLTLGTYLDLQKDFIKMLGPHLEKQMAPLQRRIHELETAPQLRYHGTWQAGRVYGPGCAVS